MNQKSHLWSGRFAEAPDTEVFDFQASFGFDSQLFDDDVEGSLAWAEALATAGVLTRDDAVVIGQALIEIREHARLNPDFLTGPDEDVHAFVERQLITRVGDVGRRLHTGRSRNEQVSLDLRLYLRRRLLVVQDKIVNLVSALAARAESAGHVAMPAYTHLRRAQPVLVAHFFLAHAAAFKRDCGRLDAARDEADALPMGSGAVVGTSYDINPEVLAERLGFSRVVANSVDAAADRDFVSAALHGYSLIMVHLSRLAEDLIIFTGEEFGYFELADAVSTGSSLMPQKKNPDALELIRGKTGRVLGHHLGWLTTMKGLPSGYNKDLQEDKEALFDAEKTVVNSVRAATTVVNTLELCEKRAEEAARGMLLATDVADYLVKRGLPFRRAHEVVGGIVRELVDRGQDFEALTLNEWQAYHELFGDDIVGQISTRGSIEARKTPQSTNPDAVTRALAELKAWLRRTSVGSGR